MASLSEYASIDELDLLTFKPRPVPLKPQPAVSLAAVATTAAASPEADVTSFPPPLPPPNQRNSVHSPTLVETKSKPSKLSAAS